MAISATAGIAALIGERARPSCSHAKVPIYRPANRPSRSTVRSVVGFERGKRRCRYAASGIVAPVTVKVSAAKNAQRAHSTGYTVKIR